MSIMRTNGDLQYGAFTAAYLRGTGFAGNMFRMAAIRQPVDPRVSSNVVDMFLSCPPANPVSSYSPSASAMAGLSIRMVWMVMVR